MPASTYYEDYIKRPEEFITQVKLNNLMKILGVLYSQASLHPENPYLTIKSIRELTHLQTSQVAAAMNQQGMKVLFEGRGIAFGLSNIGRQLVVGERQLSLAGVSKLANQSNTSANNTYLQPLTREDFNALTDKEKEDLRKVNKYVSELLIKHLSPTFGPTAYGDEEFKRTLARSIIFETQRTLTKLAPRHPSPNVHELAQQINTAKPTITPSNPNGVKESLDQANVSA